MTALKTWFSEFAKFCDGLASTPFATVTAIGIVVLWAATGPAFHFSNTWQLVMNTLSSVITFVMVFILNNAQGRNTAAIQAKLDAVIFSIEAADNRMIRVEDKTELEVQELHREIITQADD
jgi:low affinity Fe/Cu permease